MAHYGRPSEKLDDVSAGVWSPTERIAVSTTKGNDATHAHESGHALGDIYGHDRDKELEAAHHRLFAKLDPHAQTGGAGSELGRKELLARGVESLAAYGEAGLVGRYDRQFADYIIHKVLK